MNNGKFKYDIYSIKLIVDDKTIYESKYNNIAFEENYKVLDDSDLLENDVLNETDSDI